MIKTFILECTRPVQLALLFLGVVGTYICVVTGFDWEYFLYTNEHMSKAFLFIADALGFFIPIFIPLGIFVYGKLRMNTNYVRIGIAVAVASLVGFFLSMGIKVFTGRVSPPHHGPFDIDISSAFQFGFMEHHIIGGWPSSHATVMMSLAVTAILLFKYKGIQAFAVYAVALGIGIGVTFGFHWFSEFIMGSLLGFVIGRAVGVTALKRSSTTYQ